MIGMRSKESKGSRDLVHRGWFDGAAIGVFFSLGNAQCGGRNKTTQLVSEARSVLGRGEDGVFSSCPCRRVLKVLVLRCVKPNRSLTVLYCLVFVPV